MTNSTTTVAAQSGHIAAPKRALPSPFPGWVRVSASLVAVALIFVVPLIVSDGWLAALALAGAYAVAAIGLNLFTGRMGQFSMAAPFFMGVGAYGTALLGAQLGLPFLVVVVAALALGLIFGFLAGLIAIRLGGDELAITTLGILMVGQYIWHSWVPVTGGDSGVSIRDASTSILGFDPAQVPGFTREQSMFVFTWLIVAVVAYFATSIIDFRPGRALQAVHDSQRAAEAVGVDVRSYKVRVSAIMGACGALAGVLYAVLQQFAAPSGFDVSAAIMLFAMILVGGNGRVSGAILGAVLIWSFKTWISTDPGFFGAILKTSDSSPGLITPGSLNTLVYGLLIVLILMFAPKGVMSVWDRGVAVLRRRLTR
ncbi:MAG: branched-chain amino acid ABC transporter permease [Actinobacteria bacterium]|nr:branched-chain amino acid ABC transporter permease [Actinomycetota bacterium]